MVYYFEGRLGSRNTASNITVQGMYGVQIASKSLGPSTMSLCHLCHVASPHDVRWLLQLQLSCSLFSQKEGWKGRGGQALFSEYDLKVAYVISIDLPFARTQSCSPHINCEGSK